MNGKHLWLAHPHHLLSSKTDFCWGCRCGFACPELIRDSYRFDRQKFRKIHLAQIRKIDEVHVFCGDYLAWDTPSCKQVVLDKSSWKVGEFWSQSVTGIDLALGKHKPSLPLEPFCMTVLVSINQIVPRQQLGRKGEFFCVLYINLLGQLRLLQSSEDKIGSEIFNLLEEIE